MTERPSKPELNAMTDQDLIENLILDKSYSALFRDEIFKRVTKSRASISQFIKNASDSNLPSPDNVKPPSLPDNVTPINATEPSNNSQVFILEEVARLADIHHWEFQKIAHDKLKEFVITSPTQWRVKPFTGAARKLAEDCLDTLRRIDRMYPKNERESS